MSMYTYVYTQCLAWVVLTTYFLALSLLGWLQLSPTLVTVCEGSSIWLKICFSRDAGAQILSG